MPAVPWMLVINCLCTPAQISMVLVRVLPLPRSIRPDQAGLFIINIVMGLVCIFFK